MAYCRWQSQIPEGSLLCFSLEFDTLLAALPAEKQTDVLRQRQMLRTALLEYYNEKFEFWDHVPWRVLGVYYALQGGSEADPRALLADCIAEYDQAVAVGYGGTLHRVAHKLLSPYCMCGKELREYLAGNLPLRTYRYACAILRFYSLCSLVERRVESIHARIKVVGKGMPHVLPPYLCARVRGRDHMLELRTHIKFNEIVLENFRLKYFLDKVLCLRCSAAELETMRPQKNSASFTSVIWKASIRILAKLASRPTCGSKAI